MSKLEFPLNVDPPTELRFRGPFNAQVTSYMKLFNPNKTEKVCFKIKTTAPKKYCVRPNCGILQPTSGIEVAVSLQPFEYDPAEKNKHKFMVQSTICPEGESNMETIWSNVKQDDTSDCKLKCVFEMPVENEQANNEDEVATKEVKRTIEATKAAPGVWTENKQSDSSAAEFQNLILEENQLRKENMQLKEEVLRLTRISQSNLSANNQGGYRPALVQEPQGRNITDLAIAFLIALLGIILGKFIF